MHNDTVLNVFSLFICKKLLGKKKGTLSAFVFFFFFSTFLKFIFKVLPLGLNIAERFKSCYLISFPKQQSRPDSMSRIFLWSDCLKWSRRRRDEFAPPERSFTTFVSAEGTLLGQCKCGAQSSFLGISATARSTASSSTKQEHLELCLYLKCGGKC